MGEEVVLSPVFGQTFYRDVKAPETPWDRKTLYLWYHRLQCARFHVHTRVLENL
jgi:hypothetical protein